MSEEKKTIVLPHEITLEYPVEWGKNEELRTTITVVRRLKTKDFKGMPAGGDSLLYDHLLKLMSRMTGESMAFIEELDADDMMKIAEVVNHFLPSGRQIGGSI